MESTSIRLKRIMELRRLRQADILNMIKPYCEKYGVVIQRNALSQYVSGKVLPRQDKLTVLGLALDVSEAWLMGYDVPMERTKITEYPSALAPDESRLLTAYRNADDRAREDAIQTLEAHPRSKEKEASS